MEATAEQARKGKVVVHVLGCVLNKLVAASRGSAPAAVTKFHSTKLPGISVLEYLERIQKYAYCSNECFVLALIYIDRLIQQNGFTITELNIHRVLITAVLLAAKFFDDQYFNNAHYAKVGGLPLAEMNALEVEFCFRTNFSLHVTDDVYEKYHSELVNHCAICGNCSCCAGSFPELDPYAAERLGKAAPGQRTQSPSSSFRSATQMKPHADLKARGAAQEQSLKHNTEPTRPHSGSRMPTSA